MVETSSHNTPPTEIKPAQFSTIDDLAQRWKVSVKTVRSLIADGGLGCTRIGKQLRVSADDVAAFEQAHRVENAAA